MKHAVIMLWLVFAVVFLVPVIDSILSGASQEEVLRIIQREAESDQIRIVAEEEQGNKMLCGFTAGNDYGVAVFDHFADRYRYREGLMSNGKTHIDVNLDTGWDIRQYEVTERGIRSAGIKAGGGIYRIYAAAAGALAAITAAVGIYQIGRKRRTE